MSAEVVDLAERRRQAKVERHHSFVLGGGELSFESSGMRFTCSITSVATGVHPSQLSLLGSGGCATLAYSDGETQAS